MKNSPVCHAWVSSSNLEEQRSNRPKVHKWHELSWWLEQFFHEAKSANHKVDIAAKLLFSSDLNCNLSQLFENRPDPFYAYF